MDKKFLESLGIDAAAIDLILTEAQKPTEEQDGIAKELETLKADLQAKDAEIATLQQEKQNGEKLINSLKNKTKDDENAQKLIADYKNQIEQIQAQALKDRIHSNVILELVDQGCSDPELVSYLVNEDNISVNNDGSFSGISEQVQLIKADEKRSAYFKSEEKPTQPERGGYDPLGESDYSNYLDGILSNAVNSNTANNTADDPILNLLREREKTQYADKGDPDAFWDALG